MISKEELMERTGWTASRIQYLRDLELLPAPRFVPVPGRGGSKSEYPDETPDRIDYIRTLQAEGMSLASIADKLRGTEIVGRNHGGDAKEVTLKAHNNPGFDHTARKLWAEVEALLPDREIVGLRLARTKEEGKEVYYVTSALIR